MTNADKLHPVGIREQPKRNRLWLNDRLCIPLWLRTRNGTKTDKENVAAFRTPIQVQPPPEKGCPEPTEGKLPNV